MYISTLGATSAGDGLRYAVVSRLQDQLTRHQPGSHPYEVTDHAISLALNPGRAAVSKAYLERNVRRDARRILSRSRKRFVVDSFTPDTSLGREIARGEHRALVESVSTPESIAAAALLRRAIEVRVAACLGEQGLRCLAGMIDGETARETAVALGVSTRTMDRMRERVRTVAEALVAREA